MSIKTNNPVMKTDRTAKADASYLNGDYGGFAEVLSSERRCNFVFCRRGHPLLSLRFRVPLRFAKGTLVRRNDGGFAKRIYILKSVEFLRCKIASIRQINTNY